MTPDNKEDVQESQMGIIGICGGQKQNPSQVKSPGRVGVGGLEWGGAYGSISTLEDWEDLERETVGPSVPTCGFAELVSVARQQPDWGVMTRSAAGTGPGMGQRLPVTLFTSFVSMNNSIAAMMVSTPCPPPSSRDLPRPAREHPPLLHIAHLFLPQLFQQLFVQYSSCTHLMRPMKCVLIRLT